MNIPKYPAVDPDQSTTKIIFLENEITIGDGIVNDKMLSDIKSTLKEYENAFLSSAKQFVDCAKSHAPLVHQYENCYVDFVGFEVKITVSIFIFICLMKVT